MNDDWNELNALFERLVDAPAAERAIILEAETRRASRLRRRLVMMLASHDLGSIEVGRAVDRALAQIDHPTGIDVRP